MNPLSERQRAVELDRRRQMQIENQRSIINRLLNYLEVHDPRGVAETLTHAATLAATWQARYEMARGHLVREVAGHIEDAHPLPGG